MKCQVGQRWIFNYLPNIRFIMEITKVHAIDIDYKIIVNLGKTIQYNIESLHIYGTDWPEKEENGYTFLPGQNKVK